MHLVDRDRLTLLLDNITTDPLVQQCGGSAANTTYAFAGFGRSAFFAGKVAKDALGDLFVDQMRSHEIGANQTTPSTDMRTGQCCVLVTPDAERTMNTNLGISESLAPTDISATTIEDSRRVYIEGYLSSDPGPRAAATEVREIADRFNIETNLTLSDISMVEVFRDGLEQIIGDGVHRIFCNVEEASSWVNSQDMDVVSKALLNVANEVVITSGSGGCAIYTHEDVKTVEGYPVQPVDVNGAGDMFAGAFLANLDTTEDSAQAARFANWAASRHVCQFGPRLKSFGDYRSIAETFESGS